MADFGTEKAVLRVNPGFRAPGREGGNIGVETMAYEMNDGYG